MNLQKHETEIFYKMITDRKRNTFRKVSDTRKEEIEKWQK